MTIFLLAVIIGLPAVAVSLWAAGALYFDLFRGTRIGAVVAVAWLCLVAACFVFWQPAWQPLLALLATAAVLAGWWGTQQPQQDRDWDPNFARVARVQISGDQLTFTHVRNTQYRSRDDYTTQWETRHYRLSRMCGVDVLLLYWGSPWMSHPMIVFDFGEDGRVCISIEVRYRRGQPYNFLKSLFRQQELMYVVSDERDAILRRTRCLAGHDMYLYKLNGDELAMRQFFFEYTVSINRLADQPAWYHGLTANCTTGIYTQGRARMKWDWRMLLNGTLDRMMYDRGQLEQHLPFEELKRSSLLNEVANRAPESGFGDFVRNELPGYPSQTNPREEPETAQE